MEGGEKTLFYCNSSVLIDQAAIDVFYWSSVINENPRISVLLNILAGLLLVYEAMVSLPLMEKIFIM